MKPAKVQVLRNWLETVLAAAPDGLQLFYVEWNDGALGGKLQLLMNGFAYPMPQAFDPENPDHLGLLSDWSWETREPCALETARAADEDIRGLFIEAVSGSRRLASLLEARKRQLIYGPHEGPVYVHPSPQTEIPCAPTTCYYELTVAYCGNSVTFRDEDYDWDKYSTYFIQENPLPQDWPSSNLCFYLKDRRPRLTDFLQHHMLICSDRVCRLFREATQCVQTFPVPVVWPNGRRAGERVPGYSVVMLYEKLDCIAERYLTPPPWQGAPPSFNPSRGYKLIPSVVAGHDAFRLNHEHYRLLVSQKLRAKFDQLKVTGIQYLKREVDE